MFSIFKTLSKQDKIEIMTYLSLFVFITLLFVVYNTIGNNEANVQFLFFKTPIKIKDWFHSVIVMRLKICIDKCQSFLKCKSISYNEVMWWEC